MRDAPVGPVLCAGAFFTSILVYASIAWSGPPPSARCEAGKNDIAGKYAACLAKAEKGVVLKGDTGKYAEALTKCETKATDKWQSLEAKSGNGVCPSEGDGDDVQGFVEACVANVAVAVGGGELPEDIATCASALDLCETNTASCVTDSSACDDDLSACEFDLAQCESDSADCQSGLGTCEGSLGACDDGLVTCNADLTNCLALPDAAPPATGQATCYDAGNALVACAGTGQDGELQAGSPRQYLDNGDGTISDLATGLMWEKLVDDGSVHDKDNGYTWSDALGRITAINLAEFAGYDDWRLPNVRELMTIVDHGSGNPVIAAAFHSGCAGGCGFATCACTRDSSYWTSTTRADITNEAYYVHFLAGASVRAVGKTTVLHARAVRGGS